MKDKIFGVLQRVGRSFMLPIAILPVAGLLLGIGSSFTNATTIETYGLTKILGDGTLLHSLLVPAAMLLALPVIGNTNGIEKAFLIGMIAGNLSHLILDMLSGGVPLLIPFSVARIRVCNFRTGGIMDKLWRLVMYFGIGYLGLSELYQIVSKYIRI